MNFHQFSEYVEYLVFSGHKKGHGIHSPLIYDLVSRVFRNKTPSGIVFRIEQIRKRLLKDQRVININDLGAGQEVRSKQRKVSEIIKYSAINKKYGNLLSGLASKFGSPSILELGTSFGISSMYMAATCPDSIVYTIEGCAECAAVASENFREAGLTNIVQFTGSFDDVIPEVIADGIRPGLIFIDGNHRKDPTLKYFSSLIEVIEGEIVMIIDDIHYSKEMSEAWDTIKNSPDVSATIDIFRMGIVFVGKNITRNHYRIRY
jgi:predicted O-methyltransferase YrrM